MDKPIDLILISGGLGAGKTTCLINLLNEQTEKKVGVIINEFGAIGLDGRQVERSDRKMVEINHGSIFCSCLKGEFVKTLIEFSTMDLDLLCIENSGMADPSNIHQLLQEIKEKTNNKLSYRGAICLVDGVTFPKFVKVLRPIQNQVAASDYILLNKIDRVNEESLLETEIMIKKINPLAKIYRTLHAQIPQQLIEEKLKDNGYVGETSNTPYDRPITYGIETKEELSVEGLMAFATHMREYLMRMKGFLKTKEGWQMINVVDQMIDIKPVEFKRRESLVHTKFVLIGLGKEDYQEHVKKFWLQDCKVEMNLIEEEK